MKIPGGILKTALIIAACAASFATSAPAKAQAANFGASADCPTLISQAETRRNIPRGLLMAIAMTESGTNGSPNPYAMNIAGRSYFASSGQDMANVISANWQRGVTSIDVGCMQINLKYHGMKFARLTDLLNSPTNVEYGAGYLITLATEAGSWKDAVMSYHNKRNPTRRAWYGCKVWNNYLRINGSQTGYLQCGGAPSGSSTASRTTMIAQQRPVSNWSGGAGPLNPGGSQPAGTVSIGGQSVDVPIPARRIGGTIALVRDGQDIPDVVNDDARQSAFNAVRPADWSGRSRRAAPVQAAGSDRAIETAGGFGRVNR